MILTTDTSMERSTKTPRHNRLDTPTDNAVVCAPSSPQTTNPKPQPQPGQAPTQLSEPQLLTNKNSLPSTFHHYLPTLILILYFSCSKFPPPTSQRALPISGTPSTPESELAVQSCFLPKRHHDTEPAPPGPARPGPAIVFQQNLLCLLDIDV